MFTKFTKRFVTLVIVFALIFSQLSILSIAASSAKTEAVTSATDSETKASIEEELNLANNTSFTWSYDSSADAWIMSIVTAVVNPEIEDEQGVSVCVPGSYVIGIDTDRDGTADITSANYSSAVNGNMIINYEGTVTSSNGQVYTATSCPVIINTGAAGYSSSTNSLASTTYASEGYINVACGNRGKQDTATDSDGNTYYTGDAPSCLVDQKNAVRFVKYNILLGNIPGSVDYFVSTGGSGGGAHATMLAATSNNEDYYDYEIAAGAVGVYRNSDGSYSTTVTINGVDYEISDGVWGCVAYSAITSLYSADMALAFEYYLDTDYSFNTDFQAKLAEILASEYMDYINEQNLSVNEADVDLDINGDGDKTDVIELYIEYDEDKYADTNGYGGTYLDFYLAEFVSNLQWYLDNLDYADGWTWFDSDGNALSDEDVASMTTAEKAVAFIEGRYSSSSGSSQGWDMQGGTSTAEMTGTPGENTRGTLDSSSLPDDGLMDSSSLPSGDAPTDLGDSSELPSGNISSDSRGNSGMTLDRSDTSSTVTSGMGDEVGTPDSGTTQSATSSLNSSNYSSFEEMYEAYKSDIESIYSGDKYGNNIVELYNPLQYIGADTTENPTWTRILMGASEGDMSMFSSLELQLQWLAAGTDCSIEWQWDGGHVPSEILGESLSLYVDEMYGKYVDGAVTVTKAEAEIQTTNGTATSSTGTDLSSWVDYADIENVSFSLADAVSYRTNGASKAMPGFDVMDYGQEDYVFGDSETDARHWDKYVLTAFEENYSVLQELFDGEVSSSSSDWLSSSYLIIICVIVLVLIVIIIRIILSKKKHKQNIAE